LRARDEVDVDRPDDGQARYGQAYGTWLQAK